jgi:hypothetical protein
MGLPEKDLKTIKAIARFFSTPRITKRQECPAMTSKGMMYHQSLERVHHLDTPKSQCYT